MSRYIRKKILYENLNEHPAVKSWHKFDSSRTKPEEVVVLKERRKKAMGGKSAVYRLKAIGPKGTNVIAKRCKRITCMKELILYKDILPHLPIPTLDCLGFIEESNGNLCWLFLEDAGDEKYLPHIPEHRSIAAQWLGLMHTTASQITVESSLPDRGSAYFMKHLIHAQNTVLQNIDNKAFNYDELKILESIVSLLNIIKFMWKEVEQFCDQIPRTLVHCDFVPKNIRIRNGPVGIALMPLDWESSGWGAVAIDIKDLDITTYLSIIKNVWPDTNFQFIQKVAYFGKIFECLAGISWDSDRLNYQWVDRGMWRMKSYESKLIDLVREAKKKM